jgi:hypothetical protein
MTAFLISGFTAYSQAVKTGAVVGLAKVKPTAEDMSKDQFETYYLDEFFPAFRREAPAIPISLMRKIEGKRMGEYAEFYVFESLDARNEWWPKPGVSTEKAKKFFENMGDDWKKWRENVTNLAYTDYLVLPLSRKSIDVKQGNVVAVFECEITPEEGMTSQDLEKFYHEKYGPAYEKNFEGSQFCVLKGDRGERTGKYTEFVVFKSMEEYNKWLTEDGKLNEKAKQAYSNMGEIQERMEKMYSWYNYNVYVVL